MTPLWNRPHDGRFNWGVFFSRHMTKPLLTIDDLLVLLYRTNTALCSLVAAQHESVGQLNKELRQPKPLDYIIRLDAPDAPVALKIGQLIATLPATESSPVCHTVMLLDGTVTTWRGQRLVRIPSSDFNTSL